MFRYLVVAATVAAALVLAAPAGAVDPLTLKSASPRDGAAVPLTPTGGIPWQITVTGVPDDASVSLTVSSTGATGSDGVTLSTGDRVDFVFLSSTGTPGGWSGRSDPGPNAWSGSAGTYYWQVLATWTDTAGAFHSAASPVARIFVGVTPPAGTQPGSSPASRTSLRMSGLDAKYYVRTVIRRHTKRAASRLRYGCARLSTPAFRCRPTWRDGRNVYTATTATFTHVRSGGRIDARATVRGRRASRRCTSTQSAARCARPFRWQSTLAVRPAGTR